MNHIPDCDKILTQIKASNAERQREYQGRGGENQRWRHGHGDDVILEFREGTRDLKKEKEIRELK